jgi:hypothetical protein
MNGRVNRSSDKFRSLLLAVKEPPCLSLYQPTHRHHPHNQADPIRFRNLLRSLERSLLLKYPDHQVRSRLEPFETLAQDREFWNHTLEGLAVFGAAGMFEVFCLQRSVPELAVVADSFHTKPLRRFLQSTDRFHLLGLSLDAIKLFEGNRDALDEVDLAPGVPRTVTEALGDQLTEPHQTVASYGGAGGESMAMRHGHGGRADERDADAERFFRVVDRAILEHHSRPSNLPLILAALPQHHGDFRKISQNPFLLERAVKVHPDAVSASDLRQRAWEVFEPQYRNQLKAFADAFAAAKAKGLGMDDLAQVAQAAANGRVATLLIEADRQIPGRIEADTGRIHPVDLQHPEVDDLLDDLGELVLQKGGAVAVLPVERMPTRTGAAAICRY